MVERLRALLEHPLGPNAAKAMLVFASAILLGFAALFILAASEPDVGGQQNPPRAPSPSPRVLGDQPTPSVTVPGGGLETDRKGEAAQDPQDVPGSPAAQHAAQALRAHRALQHVPYRGRGIAIDLIGARGHRAVLRVRAGNARLAKAGWLRFLRRYGDSGRSYLPVFAAGGAGDG